jgi:DNA polymerase I
MSRMLLIDGDHTVHRYAHAFGPDGPEASLGFAIGRWRRKFGPTHAALVLDSEGETWRHRLWPGYKGNRREDPPHVTALLDAAPSIARGWRLPVIHAPAEDEADDVIATLTEAACARGWPVTIVSGDKDLTQLVRDDPTVRMIDEVRRVDWGPSEVEAKFGVPPAWIPDLLALIGDTSDGFSGVPGIGPKVAVPLLHEFGGFDPLMDRRNLVTRTSTYRLLREHAHAAMTCHRLASLRRDVPLSVSLDVLAWMTTSSHDEVQHGNWKIRP